MVQAHDLRILLIDDAEDDRGLIDRHLAQADQLGSTAIIDHAENMALGIARLQVHRYDCALVDLGLPDGKGVENVARIHALVPELPLIVMTGVDDEQTAESARLEGAFAYVVKRSFTGEDKIGEIILAAIDDRKVESGVLKATERCDEPSCVENSSGLIVSWSIEMQDLLGYTSDNIALTAIDEVAAPGRVGDLQIVRERVRAGEAISDFESQLETQYGNICDVVVSARQSETKKNIEWRIRDITQHRLTRTARWALEAIVSSSPDAIVGHDLDGLVTSWNPGAERVFGYTSAQVLGQPYALLIPGNLAEEGEKLRLNIRTGQTIENTETCRMHRDGKEIDVSISVAPLRDERGGLIGAFSISRDISDRINNERRILKLNDELESQMEQLRIAQHKLVEQEKLASLGDMVAGLTHEVSTPIGIGLTAASALRGEVEALRVEVAEGKISRTAFEKFLSLADEATKITQANMERASTIMSSFKRVAVDQASHAAREFDLNDYLQDILQNLAPRLGRTKHRVEIECPAGINLYSIPGSWSQVMTNLIMNSLVHAWDAGEAGCMRISVTKASDIVELVYADDGKGMAAEVLEKIWDRFYTTRRGTGGSGLGLDVVKSLMSELGGEIVAKSEPGNGSEFTITVPLRMATIPVG